jgi:hypothetical protein
MRIDLKMRRRQFRLDALIDGIGLCGANQGEAVAVIGERFDRFRADVRMETIAAVDAMNMNADCAGGFRMRLWGFACQAGLGDFPEVDLLAGAQASAGGNGSSARYRSDRIDLPFAGMEVRNVLLSHRNGSAERQQDGKH